MCAGFMSKNSVRPERGSEMAGVINPPTSLKSKKVKKIAVAGVMGAMYYVLTTTLAGISFLFINIRVADMLRGLIPFTGYAGALGIFFGHLIANMFSPLGFLDMIPVTVCLFTQFLIAYASRFKKTLLVAGAFIVHWLALTASVAYILSAFFKIPYFSIFSILLPQIFVSDFVLPMFLFLALKKIFRRWELW